MKTLSQNSDAHAFHNLAASYTVGQGDRNPKFRPR